MSDPAIAVLTGDIVRSSRIEAAALDSALAALARGAALAGAWTGTQPRFTRFRGDGWQCLAPSPRLALRTALFLRAHLRSGGRDLDSRIAVGIGPGSLPAGDSLASAGGPAFELSGRGLDHMARTSRLAVDWATPPVDAGKDRAIVALADELSRRWTPRQAQVFVRTLVPDAPTQEAVAVALDVSQQMVAKHLRAGGDRALEQALSALEGGHERRI